MPENDKILEERLTLDARKRLALNGVNSVDGFSEKELKLTVNGSKVEIKGENIKITAYNNVSGNFTADGKFNEIKFGGTKTPIIKRIFK
ncbi:MAG: hypothetical protein E7362_02780 [Clostridiales bacterium]|nr:hypothetical protein [Clostridiales bacterium]